tara:strand:+ start:618 stop:893 length:276 start_codon:yes stop_codon:yes gene_type:complete
MSDFPELIEEIEELSECIALLQEAGYLESVSDHPHRDAKELRIDYLFAKVAELHAMILLSAMGKTEELLRDHRDILAIVYDDHPPTGNELN